jgi:DNA polymerase (family 10)
LFPLLIGGGSVPTNAEIAVALTHLADLLDITGANSFKVNAYRKAARAAESEVQDLSALASSDPTALRKVEGFGESIAAKIVELATTERIAEMERLRSEVPPGLVELLTLQGVGPKTVHVLWKRAGVTDVQSLKHSIDSGALADIERMGAKTIENLRSAIAAHEAAAAQPVRFRLGQAVPIAESMLAVLRTTPGVQRAAFAGSARRGRETVGDLDLLISCDKPDAVREAFLSLPFLERVLAHGDTRCAALLRGGMQVDLRIVDDAVFGAALLYFTGSKDHNVFLRERAIEAQMRLNEYGLHRALSGVEGPTADVVAARTEESIYAALGLHCLPPELRELHGGNFEQPAPDLVAVDQVRAELHSHTTASDGSLSIHELASLAVARGFHTLAITDHSKASAQANGLSVERLQRHRDAIHAAQADFPTLRLLAGSEVDILADGRLDYDDETLSLLDIVVASPHAALRQEPKAATERLLRAITHPLVHIIGHPTGRILLGRDGLSPDMGELTAAAAEMGTALEVNCQWSRLDLRDTHVKMARAAGALVAINCDIHGAEDADNLRYGIATARRGGLTPGACVNTWEQESLLAWLRDKKSVRAPHGSR